VREDSDKRIFNQIRPYCRNGTVLEIGCGAGRISRLIAEETGGLVAVDPELESLKTAISKAPKARFVSCSGENLPFADASFPFVIFTLSLHHQDSEAALEEAARVVSRSGKVLVVEPLIEGEIERLFGIVKNEDRAKREAQIAIELSSLTNEGSKQFYAQWFFADKEELCSYLFDYYDMPYDADTARRINEDPAVKNQQASISLTDSMVLYVLSK